MIPLLKLAITINGNISVIIMHKNVKFSNSFFILNFINFFLE